MALNKQIWLYSIGTDAFYNEKEQYIHNRLLRLYTAKQKNKEEWRKAAFNRIIKKEKAKLSNLLDESNKNNTYRQLNEKALNDKNVIGLFDSMLTRALYLPISRLTKELMIVNVYFFQVFEDIVKQGFNYNGDKYVFLTASAGQIRTKRALFIKEKSFNRIKPKLMCGLTIEHINELGGINPNKFLAYLALMNSATDTWKNFDIDRAIVVEDFETLVDGEVDFIDEIDYSIKRQDTKTPIPHTDGCGMILDETTRMVRLPWIKGLLVKFPFDKFLKEKCSSKEWVVSDIYGMKHNIILEDIKYIFTKSQFKLWKYYKSWEQYKTYFKAYGCEAAYCNKEEEYIPKARINYQMLQTLSDITDEEIKKIIQPTIEEINSIGQDYQTNMRLLGATIYNREPNNFQKALILYPELFRDNYHKEILKQTKKSLVKQAKSGRLKVNGRYQFIAPDLYAFCEWLFKGIQNPIGLLQNGEIYSRLNKDKDELACLRSPHLFREWVVRKNIRNEETDKWFGETKCLYTSIHDLISKYLMFDCDGDKSLVIKDNTLIRIAKRNMKNICPLIYSLKKANGGILSNTSMYEGMINAYKGGNIGVVSNNITKVWNNEEIGEEQLNVVRWLCLYNNAVIDYAKTLWLPQPPKPVEKIIKKYTKKRVPYFFQYAKDKSLGGVEPINNSAMNRISKAIPNSRLKMCKTVAKFDYRMLMNRSVDFTINEIPIIEKFNYWRTHRWEFKTENNKVADQELYMYSKIKEDLLTLGERDYVINTLINYEYTIKKSSNKKLLWSVFGEEIINNLEKNLEVEERKICPICGKRFYPLVYNQICCDEKCSRINDNQKKRENRSCGDAKNG